MTYENVAELIEQIEALDVTDLNPSFAERLTQVVQRRQRTVAQADELYRRFVRELEEQGYGISPNSYQGVDYVFVGSAELIAWKNLFAEELSEQHNAQITARLTDGHWQVTRMYFDCQL